MSENSLKISLLLVSVRALTNIAAFGRQLKPGLLRLSHVFSYCKFLAQLNGCLQLHVGDKTIENQLKLFLRCLDRKLSDSECRPNSPWKRTGAGRVFMENLQGLPIARRVIREQEVPSSSDVDGQGAAGIKPCRCRPILGQGRTKIFTVGIRHSL
jgi:hypothetical protein